MRILGIYQHYHPDTTPYATILHAMLARFVEDGHEVNAFSAQPSYNDIAHPKQPACENIDGVTVHRMCLLPERKSKSLRRTLNFCMFLGRAILFALRSGKYDLVVGPSFPPVLMGMTLRYIKRLTGTPYAYHCQDLHPECAELAGKWRSPRLLKALAQCESQNRREAARIIVLSEDMRSTVCADGVCAVNVRIINNFAIHADDAGNAEPVDRSSPIIAAAIPKRSAAEPPKQPDVFRLMFAGNLGSFQGLHRIMETAQVLRDKSDIQFVFMGQGEQRAALQAQAGGLFGRTVHFIDYQPKNVAFSCMKYMDLGIVSLDRNIYRAAYPSKLMTYLAAGLPILAVIERESALARLVEQHSLGYVVPSPTPRDIAATILDVRRRNRTGNGFCREQVRRVADELFGRAATLQKWSQLIHELDVTLDQHGRRSAA